MSGQELRKTFLEFFEQRGHKIVPSSSLIPADPTSLFTSAGMQQFVPYLSGKVEPSFNRACSVQKCLRTDDLKQVGDLGHHTFFEMLGNWSFGDYFKEGAIDFALEFLVQELGISKQKLWVSVFRGTCPEPVEGREIPKDREAIRIWRERGIPEQKIFEYGMEENFWGPVTKTGPCGPCSEIFYDRTGEPCEKGEECGPNCDCGRFVEVWNLVFMEYDKTDQGEFEKLPRKNVDTGIGLERLLAIIEDQPSDYRTDLFWPLVKQIQKQTSISFERDPRKFRILADHLRAACFLITEGILPSKTDRGYVLRRIIRRGLRFGKLLDLKKDWYVEPINKVIEIYQVQYPELKSKQEQMITVIQKEQQRFSKTLDRGLKEFKELIKGKTQKIITGKQAFDLYQSYGLPLEFTKELAQQRNFEVDQQGFQKALKEHQKVSRAGAEKKFGGIGVEAAPLHTATHLLQAALRKILGDQVQQMGSDVNAERLRFDFSYDRALTDQEIKKVEGLVNQKIEQDLKVKKEKMPFERAKKSGALAFFKDKYPDQVTVFSIVDEQGQAFSKEVCLGPHVERTSELGKFEITKESSSGAGVRRIRARLEQ